MTLTVISPPAELPVPDAELKQFLRIGHDGEDELVSELNAAATEVIETALGQVLVSRTLERCFGGWPAVLSATGAALLPGPTKVLVAVTLASPTQGDEDVTGRFRLSCGRLTLRPWSVAPPIPADGHAAIRFEAGYGTAAKVPSDLKLAIQLLASANYSSRGFGPSEMSMPQQVSDILAAHRRIRL